MLGEFELEAVDFGGATGLNRLGVVRSRPETRGEAASREMSEIRICFDASGNLWKGLTERSFAFLRHACGRRLSSREETRLDRRNERETSCRKSLGIHLVRSRLFGARVVQGESAATRKKYTRVHSISRYKKHKCSILVTELTSSSPSSIPSRTASAMITTTSTAMVSIVV